MRILTDMAHVLKQNKTLIMHNEHFTNMAYM